jgi:hypothetical protein
MFQFSAITVSVARWKIDTLSPLGDDGELIVQLEFSDKNMSTLLRDKELNVWFDFFEFYPCFIFLKHFSMFISWLKELAKSDWNLNTHADYSELKNTRFLRRGFAVLINPSTSRSNIPARRGQ